MTIPFGYYEEETEVNGTEKVYEVVTEDIQSATDPLVMIESDHIEPSRSQPSTTDFEEDPLRKFDSTTGITELVTESALEVISSQPNLSNVKNPEATTFEYDSSDLMRMAPSSGAGAQMNGPTIITTSEQPKATSVNPTLPKSTEATSMISSEASAEADGTPVIVPDPRDASSDTARNAFIPPPLADVSTNDPTLSTSTETPDPRDASSGTNETTFMPPADVGKPHSTVTHYDKIKNEFNATLNSTQESIESKSYQLHTNIFTMMDSNYTKNIISSCLNSDLEETQMVDVCLYAGLYIMLVITCIIGFFCCCYLCSCFKKEQ